MVGTSNLGSWHGHWKMRYTVTYRISQPSTVCYVVLHGIGYFQWHLLHEAGPAGRDLRAFFPGEDAETAGRGWRYLGVWIGSGSGRSLKYIFGGWMGGDLYLRSVIEIGIFIHRMLLGNAYMNMCIMAEL